MTIKINGSRSRKKSCSIDIEDLSFDDPSEDGFIEGDIDFGNAVATFSFAMDSGPGNNEAATDKQPVLISLCEGSLTTPEPYKGNSPGVTPPIDGEYFTLKRGYQLRPSTVRKLNELKARHPDVNVYLNTILDAAILHYYDYIVKGDE